MGSRMGLRNKDVFKPLWVIDFPLLEWDEDHQRFSAMHHPFTAPKQEDIGLLETNPAAVRANAYDLVINGVDLGGGSISIYDKDLQALMFKTLGLQWKKQNTNSGF
jgi:aspartyl-tRNA synthetase